MLDCDPSYFGCGNKLSACKLKQFTKQQDYRFLIPDNGVTEVGNTYIYSTIDTVFPFVSDIEVYVLGTINHCANDLYASGLKPELACTSIGLSLDLSDDEVEFLFDVLRSGLESLNVKCTNMHSFRADQTSITLSLVAFSTTDAPTAFDTVKDGSEIYLTRPVGNWTLLPSKHYTYDNRGGFKWLLSNNSYVSELIRKFKFDYSTDISGFGLVGHLLPILESNSLYATLDFNAIWDRRENLEVSEVKDSNCSSVANMKSFSEFVRNFDGLNQFQRDVLFGGEINGPILLFLDPNSNEGTEARSALCSTELTTKIGYVTKVLGRKSHKIYIEV